MDAAGDARAGGAGAAGVDFASAVRSRLGDCRTAGGDATVQAVERLRERDRGQALADAGGPGEDQARRQRVARDRARQQRDEPPMTDDVSKRHGQDSRRIVSRYVLRRCPFGGRRRATRSRVFRSCPVAAVRSRSDADARRPFCGIRWRRRTRLAGRSPRRRCRGSASQRVMPGGCSADETGDCPEEAARRVQVAVRGRLGAAREVLGVDHRPRLELAVACRPPRRARSRRSPACPTGGRPWPS